MLAGPVSSRYVLSAEVTDYAYKNKFTVELVCFFSSERGQPIGQVREWDKTSKKSLSSSHDADATTHEIQNPHEPWSVSTPRMTRIIGTPPSRSAASIRSRHSWMCAAEMMGAPARAPKPGAVRATTPAMTAIVFNVLTIMAWPMSRAPAMNVTI
jgi:hypothetical protein